MAKNLEWDLVNGVSEYHILKYDNPNFNEATWENHIIATINDNHYEIEENDKNFYVVVYEKDNIINISNVIVNSLDSNGLVCDITVNVDKTLSNPVVFSDYPYEEFITENTGKSTFNFYSTYHIQNKNYVSNKKNVLCRTNPTNSPCYVEYQNDVIFGTNDFVIEIGVSMSFVQEWVTFCTIGAFQFLIQTNRNEIGFYYNHEWSGYTQHYPQHSDGYHKVKIERKNGVIKYYQNDFLICEITNKKSDSFDNKFYIGNRSRNDYQICYCIIDYVRINGKDVEPTNIIGDNWQYTDGMVTRNTNINDTPNFVVRPVKFLEKDFTIIGEVYIEKTVNNPTYQRTFVMFGNFGLQINVSERKIIGLNATNYYNEYKIQETVENKAVKIVYVRKNGIVSIFIDGLLICSSTLVNTVNDINCIYNYMSLKKFQIYDNANIVNIDVPTKIMTLNSDTFKFTSVVLNDENHVVMNWTDVNGKEIKIFRDGVHIGTSDTNTFTDTTAVDNNRYVYHLESDVYKSQEHIVYTHKYNPFWNAIGFELCNNDGYIWDFRSTNTYPQDNDKTKQKALYSLKPFYENKKGFGILGGNGNNDMYTSTNGCYNIKPSEPISDFTFETTINPNMFYGRDMILLHMIGTELFKYYEVYLYLNSSSRLVVKVIDTRNGVNSQTTIIQGNTALQRNTWYNIVLTKNGSSYTLYLDGKSIGSRTTNAKLGIVSVYVNTNVHYTQNSNNIYDFISLTNNVVYNGDYTVSKTLPSITDNHILYIDFENGWEDKSKHKHKNLAFKKSYIGYAEYKDNWFTSIDRNFIGTFYYHWENITFTNLSAMIEFDFIPITDGSFFRNSLGHSSGASLTSSGSGLLRYFHNFNYFQQNNTEYTKITDCRLKGVILIENTEKNVNYATLYINGVAIKSVPHRADNINRMLHNVHFFDNNIAGYISNFRVYTNILPLLKHDTTKTIGFTFNSKNIDYRCTINKNSIIIDDVNPHYVYDVFDDLGNKILDGVKKGTHNCTIERENYKIIERNTGLSFDKWIELDDEHWDNVVFYHKFRNENDEKSNHPIQSRYPMIFENGVLLSRHTFTHTRAFDIGTSDFTIEIELKTSFKTEKQESIVTINSMYENSGYGNFALNFNGGLYMADYNGSVNGSWNIANNAGANYLSNMEWRSVVIMRKNGVLTYSVDGVEMWRTNSTHNIRPHYARNIVFGYNHEMVMFRKFRITKSARF